MDKSSESPNITLPLSPKYALEPKLTLSVSVDKPLTSRVVALRTLIVPTPVTF